MKKCLAFTLIELLVVVTIIVVLLALLTPALDKAIYQADLTVCGATLKGVVSGMTTRAMDYQRLYPERTYKSQWIEIVGPGVDGRPALRNYLGPLNAWLNCPLQKGVNLDVEPATDSYIAGGYGLFNDWQAAAGEKAMRRVGDRWTWEEGSYSLLASDYELYTTQLYSSHPDRDGMMTEIVYDDLSPWGLDPRGRRTIDTWYTGTGPARVRALDRNFAYQDGGVTRLDEITAFDTDERMTIMPYAWGNGTATPQYWERIPKR